jgi:hypothetical protein
VGENKGGDVAAVRGTGDLVDDGRLGREFLCGIGESGGVPEVPAIGVDGLEVTFIADRSVSVAVGGESVMSDKRWAG